MTILLEWLIEGLAMAAIATALVRIVPSRYAAQRHLLLWTALLCIVALPGFEILSDRVSQPATQVSPGPALGQVVVPSPWIAPLFALAWASLAAWGLVRLAGAVVAVRRLTRDAARLDPAIEGAMVRLAAARSAAGNVCVVVAESIAGACAVGFFRPRIVVSGTLVRQLDPCELEAILLHECAHLERRDNWTRLAQRVVLALFGLHPAVRWISRQIDVECEAACDRLAADRLAAPQYARALARAGELGLRRQGRLPRIALAAFVPGGSLHARLLRLFRDTRVSLRAANAGAAGAAVVLVALGLTAIVTPPLVAIVSIEASIARIVGHPAKAVYAFAQENPAAFASSVDDGRIRGGEGGKGWRGGRDGKVGKVGKDSPMSDANPATIQIVPSGIGAGLPAVPDIADPTAAQVPGEVAPLVSVPLPSLPAEPPALAAYTITDASRWGAVGSKAAEAGVSAGRSASRAGSAIGRAFTRGGLAIARSF